ncbi:MAG TPA: hypothetical protein VEX18_08550, partial [Polyangiaceae bacterium]|nr:hypothetical protein [Polyangiaceae bacterium]
MGAAECSSEPGCEPLDTAEDCGACGRNDCEAPPHTSLDCSNPDGCLAPLCDAGYANCDRSELDCEAADGASCWPEYVVTHFYSEQLVVSAAAFGSDGSLFLVGTFAGSMDFDPSSAMDVIDAAVDSLFVTKLNPDSTYGWTRVVEGAGSAVSVSYPTIEVASATAGSAGSILLTGTFDSVVDFDPGPGTESMGTTGAKQAYVLSIATDGSLGWVRSWAGFGFGLGLTRGPGVIYASGNFEGYVDLDPGPGTDAVQANDGYVVKLTDGGDYIWGRLAVGCSALRIAADDSVWCLGGSPASLAAAFESDGTVRDVALDLDAVDGARLEASAGNIYLAGSFSGRLELADGDVELVRVTRSSAGALVTLDLQSKIVGARRFPEGLVGLAAAPDGILALDFHGSVFSDYADGDSKFQLTAAAEGSGLLLVSSPTEFAV